MEYEGDSDTNYKWSTQNNPKVPEKETQETKNSSKNQERQDDSTGGG